MGLSTVVSCDIDKTISHNFQQLRKQYRINWSGHHCDVIGCGTAIISDGGMKPHRKERMGLFIYLVIIFYPSFVRLCSLVAKNLLTVELRL